MEARLKSSTFPSSHCVEDAYSRPSWLQSALAHASSSCWCWGGELGHITLIGEKIHFGSQFGRLKPWWAGPIAMGRDDA